MFSIDTSSPQNAALAGPVAGGTFNGGPGKISLQIALGGTQAINLSLIGARAKGTGITATAVGALNIGGAVTQDDLNTKVLPAVATEIQGIVVRDCCGTGNAAHPDCTGAPANDACYCTASSTGSEVLMFDTNKDCMITTDELKSNQIIQSFLAPDVSINTMTNQACKVGDPAPCADSLSLGIQVTGVGAQYTVSGETN
jgi:hypothetical protein